MPSPSRILPPVHIHRPGLNLLTLLTVVMLVIQFWLDKLGGPTSPFARDHYLALGLSWDGVSSWRLWQFFTHALTHAGWFHLLVNLLMLWFVGGKIIHILGSKRFAVIILASVLAGGAMHVVTDYWITRSGYPATQLVGFSGACFALLLTLTTLSPESRMWPVPVSGRNLGLGLMLTELLLWLMTPELGVPGLAVVGGAITQMGGAEIFKISHACHFGGMLAGWTLSRRLLAPRPSLADLQRARARQEAKLGIGEPS